MLTVLVLGLPCSCHDSRSEGSDTVEQEAFQVRVMEMGEEEGDHYS